MSLSIKVRLLGVALAATVGACLYDAADPCGPGEILDPNESCVCAPGNVPVYRSITVLSPVSPAQKPPFSACKPCAADEVISGDRCVCAAGFVRGASGCVPSNLGAACAAELDCAAGDQRHCRLPGGYCTKAGCASNADCDTDADYACATSATPPYCRRPPLGQGAACTMMGADPACLSEAPLCLQNACVATGCQTDADCSPSRRCCDLSMSGQPGLTVCLAGACP